MSTSGDNNMNHPAQNFENYVPNVAYTYGEHQPVLSTYIAHDPFFFMDVDDVTLEEELLAELERNFGHGHDTAFEDDGTSNFLDVLINFDENLDFLHGEGISEACDMNVICDVLKHSRYASALMEFAEVNHIKFVACAQIANVQYERSENIILFQPALSEMEMTKGLIKALRQAWQNYQGALLQPVALYPDHAVFIHRAQKADIAGAMVRIAWELELAGHHDLWSDLEGSTMRDLTHAFGREAVLDFRSLNNGRAGFAVFETWFLSDRSKSADTQLIQKMLAEYQGHQFEDEDMSQLVVIDLVKALGEMPYGKNYLAGHIPSLLVDPIFTEVRERSAANFLWFIKFEKTFTEVERSLQKDSLPSKGVHPTSDGTIIAKRNGHLDGQSADEHADEFETGILIPFPKPHKRGDGKGQQGRNIAGESGQVIPFDIAVRPFNGNFFS